MALSPKTKTNFVLEGAALLALMSMIATGLVLEFRLPPGSGGMGGRGRLGALEWAGLSRHEWGEIHFYLAITFIALLVAHIVLHWRWIWAVARGNDPARRTVRALVFLLVTLFFLGVAAIPWLIPVREHEGSSRRGARQHSSLLANPQAEPSARP